MSINNFLNKDNINTLWDVISDEDIFKFLTRDIQSKIAELFSNNIKGFFEIEGTKTSSLVAINKKYILLILNHIKINYTPQLPNKIKILEEAPLKESITYEEIQNDRKNQFEKDLIMKQTEFENSMTKKTPPLPEFADKHDDKPIAEMDKIIKEMTAKRNYDVEQITKNNIHDDKWLKPQETSIKSEKITKEEYQPLGNRLKYLNNESQPLISPTKKSVTWGNNTENDIVENYIVENTVEEENIFKKLKKVKNQETNNITFNIEPIHSEDKISVLQTEVKNLNLKFDKIIELLNNKNIFL
jgi:hypothetical protein